MEFILSNSLRAVLAEQKLPNWACDICSKSYGTTVAQLPSEIAMESKGDQKALEHYFTTLLSRRIRDPKFSKKLCLPYSEVVLDEGVIRRLDLSVRTKNCLASYAEEHPEGIIVNELTFHDLIKVPNMGSKSVIEFFAYMEGITEVDSSTFHNQSEEESIDPRMALANLVFEMKLHPWCREIVCGDPRFPEIQRPIGSIHLSIGDTLENFLEGLDDFSLNYPNHLVQSAVDILKSVREKVDILRKMPLDAALKDYIKALYKRGKQVNLEAMYMRFGLIREGRVILEEAGQLAGITRERVRQIEKKILDAMVRGDYPTFIPGLDDAIKLLNDNVGMNVLEFSDALNDQGITNTNISADAVVLFADLCNRGSVTIKVKKMRDGTRVISSESLNLNRLYTILGRLSSRNGIADIKVAARHFNIDEEKFTLTAKKFLSGGKLWFSLDPEQRWWTPTAETSHSRNRLINVARKVLSVSNPVSVDDIREGFLKLATVRNSSHNSYSGDWAITVPSRAAILLFFKRQDIFKADSEMIFSEEILDYRELLGDVERTIVEVILNSPTGVMRRKDIIKECSRRGSNENSVGLYTSYSPIVQHIAQETFKLVGKEIAVSALSAHQAALSNKIRKKTILLSDWKDGRIRLCIRCPEQVNNMVVGAPAAFRDFLKERSFEAYDLDDKPVGTISSNNRGDMWGMMPFCRVNGMEENDILSIEFDIAAGKAYLYQTVLSEILDDIE